jgi:hypothetical protein
MITWEVQLTEWYLNKKLHSSKLQENIADKQY